MKDNWNLRIVGDKVELVPYTKKLVPRYHDWMLDPYIQAMTASEPLTIEEEYEMQQSWHLDGDKCTFNVLASHSFYDSHPELHDPAETSTDDEIQRMVGDINIFVSKDYEDESIIIGELNIMTAVERHRGHGMAKEALYLMLDYGIKSLGIKRYFAKIDASNDTSISLFKKVGFIQTHFIKAFNEVELELQLTHEAIEDISKNASHAQCQGYIHDNEEN